MLYTRENVYLLDDKSYFINIGKLYKLDIEPILISLYILEFDLYLLNTSKEHWSNFYRRTKSKELSDNLEFLLSKIENSISKRKLNIKRVTKTAKIILNKDKILLEDLEKIIDIYSINDAIGKIKKESLMKKLVVYHHPCLDGMSALWVFNKKFGDEVYDTLKGNYHQELDLDKFKDKDVYLLDFSYKYDDMMKIIEIANSVTIYDHHKTAVEELQGLLKDRSIKGVIDSTRAGSMITFNELFPDEKPPLSLKYIQDRDIHSPSERKLINTKYFSEYAFLQDFTLDSWDLLMDDNNIDNAIEIGKLLLVKKYKDIKKIVNSNFLSIRELKDYSGNVLTYNGDVTLATDLSILLDTELVEEYDIKFLLLYQTTNKLKVACSFRSKDDLLDVSEVAETFGGGGHRNASGCTIDDINDLLTDKVIDFNKDFINLEI